MTIEESSDDLGEALGFSEEELIEGLIKFGLENPDVLTKLNQWTAFVEAERDQKPRGAEAEAACVDIEIRRATLYSKTNLKADGEELAPEAWNYAHDLASSSKKEFLIARVVQAAKAYGYSF